MAYIYKIVNSVNDKVYIGQTIKKPKLRLTEHIYHATHPKIAYFKRVCMEIWINYQHEVITWYDLLHLMGTN